MKYERTSRAWGTLAAMLASLHGSQLLAANLCSVESIQALAPAGMTIQSAAPTPLPVPHCKIDGSIITNHPGPNTVNFRLQLPDSGWTGRYYFIGMGGSAGYVPTDSQIPAGNPLNRGIAVAGTDTGRQGDMLDWGFLVDPAKAKDHIDRAAHVTAVATQQITKRYTRPKNYTAISPVARGVVAWLPWPSSAIPRILTAFCLARPAGAATRRCSRSSTTHSR